MKSGAMNRTAKRRRLKPTKKVKKSSIQILKVGNKIEIQFPEPTRSALFTYSQAVSISEMFLKLAEQIKEDVK